MVEIYTIKIDELIKKETYNQLLSCVSEEKRERIKRFHFIEDAKRTLYGELLVRYLACSKLDATNKGLKIYQNEFGKPFLYGYPNFHFNISHSGVWVVCAISEKIVGVDVELMKPIDFDIAERFFSDIEYQNLSNQRKEIQLEYFYDLWTLKESYIKCMGKGLSIALNSFHLVIDDQTQTVNVIPNQTPPVFLSRTTIDNRYKLSICSEDEVRTSFLTVNKIDINNIKEKILYGNQR